jgi:polyisoprenyl-phosphate glycosyltransferase
MQKPILSIVVPLFNEEESIPALLTEVKRVGSEMGISYELILVDDGSKDATLSLIIKASEEDRRVKIVSFSRNFGHQAAFNAGIDHAEGEYVVTMDGDLQHPPSLIPDFYKKAKEGNDIVLGQRVSNDQNSTSRSFIGTASYKLLSKSTGLDFTKNASDFGMYSNRVISVLKKLPERERFLRGMVQWVGFKKAYVPYRVGVRQFGEPKYNFRRLFNLGLSGITSFSAFPLRLSFWTGLFVLLASVGFTIYVIVDHYVNPNPVIAGWATVIVLVLVLGSIQLMVLGVVGEYLYKMFNEIKGRPLYIVASRKNFDNEQSSKSHYGID